jgi:hypothetical protein
LFHLRTHRVRHPGKVWEALEMQIVLGLGRIRGSPQTCPLDVVTVRVGPLQWGLMISDRLTLRG